MSYKKGSWTVVNTKEIYKNPWIEVTEDKVIRPDGKDGIFGIVASKSAAMILPIDKEGNVYLIEQYRYSLETKTIEAPCGGIEDKEKIIDGAKRELLEETGIIADKWTELGFVNPLSSFLKSQLYLFVAENLSFSKSNPEGTEEIKVLKIPFKQAIEWAKNGKINDSITIAILFRAEKQKQNK